MKDIKDELVIDVIRIETSKASMLHFNSNLGKMTFEMLLERENNQLLYFVSEIKDKSTLKDGDWIYWKNGDFQGVEKIKGGVFPKTTMLRKIEASNDLDITVPLIPDKFLIQYIESFNNGNEIKTVVNPPDTNEPMFSASFIKEKLEQLKQPEGFDPDYSPTELIANRRMNQYIDDWYKNNFWSK